jgi:hypothetical protein
MSFPTPILNLDFVNAKQLGDKVAFSRASNGTFFDRNGILRSTVDNMPRFDHDPLTGICKGLLIEPQVPFLETYSEQLDQWNKSVGITVTANAALAPDGTMTADKVIHSDAGRDEFIYRSGIFGNGAVSCYCFLKKDEHRYVFVEISDFVTSSIGVVVDLETGTPSSFNTVAPWTGGNYKVDDVGGGWYKVTVWGIAAQGTQKAIVVHPCSSTGVVFAGNGSDGFYTWGAKIYAGTGPTSYLPSGASPVTRAADIASVDLTQLKGPAGEALWNGKEGTIVIDFDFNSFPISSITAVIASLWYDANNRITLYRYYNNTLRFFLRTGNTTYLDQIVSSALEIDKTYRAAFSFSATGACASVNGVTSAPSGSITLPTPATRLDLFEYAFTTTTAGHIRSIQLYNRRIDDEYLSVLSAL